MKKVLAYLALVAVFAAAPAAASAACTVEYKAKRDTPFTLVYDVTTVSGPCTLQDVKAKLVRKLEAQGLVLLKVLSVKES